MSRVAVSIEILGVKFSAVPANVEYVCVDLIRPPSSTFLRSTSGKLGPDRVARWQPKAILAAMDIVSTDVVPLRVVLRSAPAGDVLGKYTLDVSATPAGSAPIVLWLPLVMRKPSGVWDLAPGDAMVRLRVSQSESVYSPIPSIPFPSTATPTVSRCDILLVSAFGLRVPTPEATRAGVVLCVDSPHFSYRTAPSASFSSPSWHERITVPASAPLTIRLVTPIGDSADGGDIPLGTATVPLAALTPPATPPDGPPPQETFPVVLDSAAAGGLILEITPAPPMSPLGASRRRAASPAAPPRAAAGDVEHTHAPPKQAAALADPAPRGATPSS